MTKTPTPASHAVNTAPISADLRATNGTAAQPDQDGFVQWLSGTYPDAYNADEARHLWRHEHISALAWEAAKARYAAQPARECLQQSTEPALPEGCKIDLSRMREAALDAQVRGYLFKADGSQVRQVIDLLHEKARQLAALKAAPPAPEAVAVLYVSPEQLAKHTDPEGPESAEAGRYLPTRKTPAGKFTQPLYAQAAAPAQAVAVPDEVELPDVEDMAHSAVQEALSYGVSHDVFHRWMRAVMDKTVQALTAAPAQEHATQLAGQGQEDASLLRAGLLAAAAHVQAKANAHAEECGSYDPDTGAFEMRDAVQDHYNTLDELAEEIRMLADKAVPEACDKPPAGWACTRAPGHDGPCAAAPVQAQEDARDAARYRWLRRWKGQEHEPPFTVQHEVDGSLWGGDLDAAIDAARAAQGDRDA